MGNVRLLKPIQSSPTPELHSPASWCAPLSWLQISPSGGASNGGEGSWAAQNRLESAVALSLSAQRYLRERALLQGQVSGKKRKKSRGWQQEKMIGQVRSLYLNERAFLTWESNIRGAEVASLPAQAWEVVLPEKDRKSRWNTSCLLFDWKTHQNDVGYSRFGR